MTCQTCADKGLVRLNYVDGDEYGICLCSVGERMRREQNEGHTVVLLWRLWCAREQVDPAKVHRIEDVLTPEELAAKGFRELTSGTAMDAVAAAAKARSAKR